MTEPRETPYAELADLDPSTPEWRAWADANPEAAQEVELARKVRALLVALREAEMQVPEGVEVRLMERLREDRALVDLVDLWVSGIGRAVLELLGLIFALIPAPAPQPNPA